jgi:hypothetical protein
LLNAHDLFTGVTPKVQRIRLAGRRRLNVPFLAIRTFVFLAIWIAFSMLFVRNSTRQDVKGCRTHAQQRPVGGDLHSALAITITFTAVYQG